MLQSVEGEEATGKTSYAYTAPLKIVGFAFDMGVERALVGPRHQGLFSACKIKIVPYGDRLTAVWQDNDITIYELPPPIQLDSIKVNGCRYLWSQFIVLAAEALQDNSVKTIVVDTMSVARRVKASAYLEALQDDAIENKKPMRERLLQIEWAAPNDAVRDLYTTAQGLKKNLIAVHHLTDERTDKVDKDGRVVQGVLTGKRILEGLSQTYRFVDVAMRFEKTHDQAGPAITARLTKCGYSLAMEGAPLTNPDWDSVVELIEMGIGGRLKFERRTPLRELSPNG